MWFLVSMSVLLENFLNNVLEGCFDCTNWDVFRNSCESLDELTDDVGIK